MVSTLLQDPVLGHSARNESEQTFENPVGRPLAFQQTIPRSLVHRAAVSEVFVTDLNILGEDRFEVGAQWPRRHTFFGPRTRTSHDPMLFAETCRQAGLLIAHRGFGVPLGHSFLSDHKTCTVDEDGLGTEGSPVDVVLQVSAHDVQHRGRNIGGMRYEIECFRDGHLIGTTSERWRAVSPAVYRRMRGDHYAATPFQARVLPKVAPALVGRERSEDVLVAETGQPNLWSLQFDPEHSVLFDHAVDHVPGMVMLEAACQAALLTVGDPQALPVHTEFGFEKYLEFDEECLLHVVEVHTAEAGTRMVGVTFKQGGATIASGMLAMRLS